MKKTSLLLIVATVVIAVLIGSGFVLYEYGKKEGEKKPASTSTTKSATTSATSEEDINKIIRDCVMGIAASSITDVSIDKKYYYTDSSDTRWIRFHVSPIPVGSADPAYGVIKKVTGAKWAVVDFGTAGVEDTLPADVKTGLEFE